MLLRLYSIVLLLLATLGANAQDPLHRRFTMQHGLPSNTVYRCMQDREGFLWLSTDAGVVRYDGTHLDHFGLEEGLTDEDVFATYCDRQGRIWFFSANGLPSYVLGNQVHSGRTDTTLAKVKLLSGVCSIHEDPNGTLWFGGLRGELAIVYPDGLVEIRDLSDPQRGIMPDLVNLHPLDDGRVQVFNGKLPVDLDVRALPSHSNAIGRASVEPPELGRFLVVGKDSVEEWRDDHWSLLLTRHDLPGATGIANAVRIDEDELWVGLSSGGVLWLRQEAGRWVPVRDVMFPQDLITHTLRDKEGNIWLSTSYGGFIVVSATSLSTSFYHGVRGGNEEFLRVHTSDAVGVWLGTNKGDVYRFEGELQLVELPAAGPVFSRVSCIRSSGKELWVITEYRTIRWDMDRGVGMAEDMYVTTELSDRKVPFTGAKSLTMATDGRIVASAYGLWEYDRKVNAFRPMIDSAINMLRIYAPHFDERGTLWFEENSLLKSFSSAGFRSYPEFELEAGYRITDITSIGDTLFLATNGKGVLLLAGGRPFKGLTQADGLSSDHVQRMFMDRGELFLATDRGADRLSGPWTSPTIVPRFAGLSGASRRLRDVVVDSSNAYLLLADGLLVLPRSKSALPRGVPVPYVRSVHVNDQLVTEHGIVGIRGRQDRLAVEFGAIHYTEPERVIMQYRMRSGGAWFNYFGGAIDLSATGAGNHILQVRASVDNATWSEPVEMMVVVVPPLRDRWWVRAMLLVLAAMLVVAVLRYGAYRRFRARVKQLHEREKLAMVRQRMAMDLHDDLGAELSSILLLTRIEREHPEPGSLERVEQLIGTLTEKVKEVIWSTDPGSDTLEATLEFIQRYTIKLCERHGIRIRTTIPTMLPRVELDAGRRRELFLIAKEAVNNTVKHAEATAFSLVVTVEERVLVLDLADDGQGGVPAGDEHSGYGLRNMAKRAEGIGATLEFREVRPHGTRIRLRLPIHQSNPNG